MRKRIPHLHQEVEDTAWFKSVHSDTPLRLPSPLTAHENFHTIKRRDMAKRKPIYELQELFKRETVYLASKTTEGTGGVFSQ